MYGVEGQGEDKKGIKSKNTGKCSKRRMMVTVTADEDMASGEVVLLEAGSYGFFDEESVSSSAISLMRTGAVVSLAAVSLCLF